MQLSDPPLKYNQIPLILLPLIKFLGSLEIKEISKDLKTEANKQQRAEIRAESCEWLAHAKWVYFPETYNNM